MLLFVLLGLGIGIFLAGITLLVASYFFQKRMPNPALIRWAGVVGMAIGCLLGIIARFWR